MSKFIFYVLLGLSNTVLCPSAGAIDNCCWSSTLFIIDQIVEFLMNDTVLDAGCCKDARN